MQATRSSARPANRASYKPSGTLQTVLGGLMLLVGAAAFSGMLVWGYFTLMASSETAPAPAAEEAMLPEALPAQDATQLEGAQEAQPAAEAQIQGLWEAPFARGDRAVIAFSGGTYQIQLADKPPSSLRRYAIGTYSVQGNTGLMTLRPDRAAEPEKTPGMVYETLTVREYTIEARYNPQTGRLFLRPHIIEGMNDQVHPLFFYVSSGEGDTGWTKREP